ncbi:MAG: HD domain-containing phosphohydrolase [Gemmatimonadota bacterium]
MRIPTPVVATVGTVAATALLEFDRKTRQTAERFGAAALESLLNAIDANDPDTGAHVRRVATYALILADAGGLGDNEQHQIERVALFHDIGKIHHALFDIIHETSRLNRAERRAIATHPQRGADVLAPLAAFYPELPAGILSHHERWNGTGYPRGLKARRIPIAARIVAIADTFDAITHHRRYSDGRSVTKAHDILLEGRGSQFDPEWLDLFLLPPVFAEICREEKRIAKWRKPTQHRRTGKDESWVPDVIFRWRPGRTGSRGRPASDEARRSER